MGKTNGRKTNGKKLMGKKLMGKKLMGKKLMGKKTLLQTFKLAMSPVFMLTLTRTETE